MGAEAAPRHQIVSALDLSQRPRALPWTRFAGLISPAHLGGRSSSARPPRPTTASDRRSRPPRPTAAPDRRAPDRARGRAPGVRARPCTIPVGRVHEGARRGRPIHHDTATRTVDRCPLAAPAARARTGRGHGGFAPAPGRSRARRRRDRASGSLDESHSRSPITTSRRGEPADRWAFLGSRLVGRPSPEPGSSRVFVGARPVAQSSSERPIGRSSPEPGSSRVVVGPDRR